MNAILYIAIFLLLYRLFKPKPKKEVPYGKPNTKAQQKVIDAQMKEFLETNPNHSFFDDNPQYKEKYLKEIDLSELDLDKK